MIHGHGGDSYLFDVKYDLSSNVIPEEYNFKLLSAIKSMKFNLTKYPEPDAGSLATLFEKRYSLSRGSTIVLNGSVEGIYIWAERFKNSRFLIMSPSFSEYEDAVKRFGSPTLFSSLVGLESFITFSDSVIICNPNNPDGSLLPKDYILSLVGRYPDKNFLIDEAYIDIAGEEHSLIKDTQYFGNLYVLRSMTKFFSLPGIRLGFLSFSPENYDDIIKYKYPWSVNAVAIQIGTMILKDYDKFCPDLRDYKRVIKSFCGILSQIDAITFSKSDTNYFLCRSKIKSSLIKSRLLKEYGILIRDASNFRTLDEYHFRVSVQSEKVNLEFVKGICSILQNF